MKVGMRVLPFNFRLREERVAQGMTQKQLADLVGINVSDFGLIERLSIPSLSIARFREVLHRIARTLEVSFADLFPDDYLEAVAQDKLPKRRRNSFLWCIETSLDNLLTSGPVLSLPSAEEEAEINLTRDDIRRAINDALKLVTPREQQIIRARYGLDNDDEIGLTYKEIGEQFGVTRERIRQVEQRALRRLRHPARSRELRELLYGDCDSGETTDERTDLGQDYQ